MCRVRCSLAGLAIFLTFATLTAGCGSTDQTVPAAASGPSAPAIPPGRTTAPPLSAVSDGRHGGRGGSFNGSQAATGGLPADWPSDLPIPAGDIIGSTGSAGRWSVLIVAAGSAASVRQSTVALYTGVGFAAVSDSVLNKRNRRITLVVVNRDHSATQTNLVIGVTSG